jgi:hypothetical protein
MIIFRVHSLDTNSVNQVPNIYRLLAFTYMYQIYNKFVIDGFWTLTNFGSFFFFFFFSLRDFVSNFSMGLES